MQSLNNLPVGAKVKFGSYSVNGEAPQRIAWILVDNKKYVEFTEGVVSGAPVATLLCDNIIDLRAFDAKENSNDSGRAAYGYNDYRTSNIHQWLNSDANAGEWYSNPRGDNTDRPPAYNSSKWVTDGTEYDTRPGFLNAFTVAEKEKILHALISAQTNQQNRFVTGVYLPATWDMYDWFNITGGTDRWGYFYTTYDRTAKVSEQAYTNTRSTTKPATVDTTWRYWFRNILDGSTYNVRCQPDTGTNETGYAAYTGSVGVRPALRINRDTMVSDTVDEDGCYAIIAYDPITPPATIVVPTIYEGQSHTISWSVPTNIVDYMGDVVYKVEWAYEDGVFVGSEIVSGTQFTHVVDSGHTTIQYRVSAAYTYDNVFGTPSYSDVVTIINNTPPYISGEDENLGTKTEGFEYTYMVEDIDTLDVGEITVEEAIDGTLIRSFQSEQALYQVFDVSGTNWLKVTNGSHTMTITAIDKRGARSVRTIEFTKSVTTLSLLTRAMEAESMPIRLLFTVTKKLPIEATYTVEVCNNGFDASPTWEDATAYSDGDTVYVFENKSKTADKWGVAIRVTVDRNGGTGECYISGIGGNFE